MPVHVPTPEAFIYDAIRMPRGRGKSAESLHSVQPVTLVVGLFEELRQRNSTLDPQFVDDVVLGVVPGGGPDLRAVVGNHGLPRDRLPPRRRRPAS